MARGGPAFPPRRRRADRYLHLREHLPVTFVPICNAWLFLQIGDGTVGGFCAGRWLRKVNDGTAHATHMTGKKAKSSMYTVASRTGPGRSPEWAKGLRQLYDSVVEEPLPDSFADLIAKLDSKSR